MAVLHPIRCAIYEYIYLEDLLDIFLNDPVHNIKGMALMVGYTRAIKSKFYANAPLNTTQRVFWDGNRFVYVMAWLSWEEDDNVNCWSVGRDIMQHEGEE